MFIQTEATSDPGTVKFLPGKPVMPSGTAEFADIEASNASPLARRLFAIDGVARVALDAEAITVAISDAENWQVPRRRFPTPYRLPTKNLNPGRFLHLTLHCRGHRKTQSPKQTPALWAAFQASLKPLIITWFP